MYDQAKYGNFETTLWSWCVSVVEDLRILVLWNFDSANRWFRILSSWIDPWNLSFSSMSRSFYYETIWLSKYCSSSPGFWNVECMENKAWNPKLEKQNILMPNIGSCTGNTEDYVLNIVLLRDCHKILGTSYHFLGTSSFLIRITVFHDFVGVVAVHSFNLSTLCSQIETWNHVSQIANLNAELLQFDSPSDFEHFYAFFEPLLRRICANILSLILTANLFIDES